MSEVDYWDAEARDDPRYASGTWGTAGPDDGERCIPAILDKIARCVPHGWAQILEIGCGPARLLIPLARRFPNAQLNGIDISPEMRRLAVGRISQAMLGAQIRIGGPEASPTNVDTVYCVELLQHLDDAAALAVLDRAWDALRPAGKLLVQYVSEGETGSHSFPRRIEEMVALISPPRWRPGLLQRGEIHPHWDWLSATKIGTTD